MGTIFYSDLQPYDEPNLPWADGEMPDRSTLNPYGFWNGHYVKNEEPLCRYTRPLYSCSLCGDNTTADPVGFEKWAVIMAHWLPFPIGVFALWCIWDKSDVLKQRIFCPFLLMVSVFFLGLGSMAEADNHSFAMNWNACYDSSVTFSKLYFLFFIGSGYSLMMISLRKAGVPLVRKPSGACDTFFFVSDWILIVFTVFTPIVWAVAPGPANTMFIVTQSVAAIVGIPRLYTNLGPSKLHLVVGTASQLVAVVGAVPVDMVLTASGNQYWHVVLAFTFVLDEFGIAYCIYKVLDPKAPEAGRGENAPLI